VRGSSAGTGPDAVSDEIAGTGCSRLCFILAGVGLSLTAASTLLTYRVLHEQMESLGASVVDHLSSSNCTAITKVLSALSVARSEVVSGESEHLSTTPAPSTAIGVLTPSTRELATFQANGISRAEALSVLQSLPGGSLAAAPSSDMATQIARASRSTLAELQTHRCNLGYGLNPMAVRVFGIPALNKDHGHHAHGHQPSGPKPQPTQPAGEASSWLAFLYGPWPTRSPDRIAFALVDLNATTMQASGHDHSLNDMFPGGSGELAMRVQVKPATVLKDPLTLHRAMPSLEEEDHKLLGLKLVPFANQLLQTEISIDHSRLDRVPRRSSAFVFLIGLLATSAVVLMSRSSQIRMRRLNQVLAAESRTDGLTRVANRRAWDEALIREESRRRRHGHRYGLLVIDLDGFKQINDAQGHAQGDAILQQAAKELKDELRDTDLLARVGGDEFAVLVFQPNTGCLDDLVKRLRVRLQTMGIQASIGAVLSEAGRSLEQTWSLADQAMYRVKGRPAATPSPQPNPTPPATSP
jgi:diguanylate cyclase (GGDEF)-like protein